MTQNMELIERIERMRDLNPLDAAEELMQSPVDDIQFILSRLPAEQAQLIASHLGDLSAPEEAATRAVLSGMEETVGELMTPVTATLPDSYTVAEALTFMVNRAALDNQKKYCPSGYNAQKCIRLYAAGAQKPSRGQLSLVCSLSL